MWLYFNSKGQLTTILEHGSPARVGTTNFDIFAVIEGLDETNIADYMATIKFFKPDLTNSSYPTLLMENASAVFKKMDSENDTGNFQNNHTYYGFVFRFNEIVDNNGTPLNINDDNQIVLLDTNGLWKAVINIISDIHGYNVQGMATFEVAGTGTEKPSTIDYDIITSQLVQNINRRALKKQTIVTNTYVGIVASLGDYENGQMFYGIDTHKLYQKVDNELIEIGDFQVDSFLSTTSENPVQNKVVTQAIYDSVAGAYRIRGSATVQTLEAMEKTENMNGYIYNMLNKGSLTNKDGSEISFRVGDNVVFVWNEGEWYWDNMVGFVDTSNLVTTNTAQIITGFKRIKGGMAFANASGASGVYYVEVNGSSEFVIRRNDTTALALGLDYLEIHNRDLLPTEENTNYSIGSSTAQWKDGYFSRNLYASELFASYLNPGEGDLVLNNSGVNFRPSLTNSDNLGTSGYKWKDLYIAGAVKGAATMTQAQYDALVSGGTVDADTFYFIEEE